MFLYLLIDPRSFLIEDTPPLPVPHNYATRLHFNLSGPARSLYKISLFHSWFTVLALPRVRNERATICSIPCLWAPYFKLNPFIYYVLLTHHYLHVLSPYSSSFIHHTFIYLRGSNKLFSCDFLPFCLFTVGMKRVDWKWKW